MMYCNIIARQKLIPNKIIEKYKLSKNVLNIDRKVIIVKFELKNYLYCLSLQIFQISLAFTFKRVSKYIENFIF